MRHNQNRRSRGRSNNRKGPNPLTRSYESNGPDVKVRGTAMHVAEKYMSLARDALASGDNVAAENYLQHAEHYNRIVAAAQAQLLQAQSPQFREGSDEDADEDRAPRGRDRFGYYTDPEGEEDGFDTGIDDQADRAPPRQAPRPDYRGQDQRPQEGRTDYRGQDNRGPDNRQDRGYQNGPRRDNRDGYVRNDSRDNREGRSDYRDNRNDNRGEGRGFNGERPRSDYRDARHDQPQERFNGERRPDSREGGRTEATPEPYTAEGAAVQEREFRGEAPAERSEAERALAQVTETGNPGGAPDAAAPDETAPRPRRRRAPRKTQAEAGAADPDATRDGEAALAAFPD